MVLCFKSSRDDLTPQQRLERANIQMDCLRYVTDLRLSSVLCDGAARTLSQTKSGKRALKTTDEELKEGLAAAFTRLAGEQTRLEQTKKAKASRKNATKWKPPPQKKPNVEGRTQSDSAQSQKKKDEGLSTAQQATNREYAGSPAVAGDEVVHGEPTERDLNVLPQASAIDDGSKNPLEAAQASSAQTSVIEDNSDAPPEPAQASIADLNPIDGGSVAPLENAQSNLIGDESAVPLETTKPSSTQENVQRDPIDGDMDIPPEAAQTSTGQLSPAEDELARPPENERPVDNTPQPTGDDSKDSLRIIWLRPIEDNSNVPLGTRPPANNPSWPPDNNSNPELPIGASDVSKEIDNGVQDPHLDSVPGGQISGADSSRDALDMDLIRDQPVDSEGAQSTSVHSEGGVPGGQISRADSSHDALNMDLIRDQPVDSEGAQSASVHSENILVLTEDEVVCSCVYSPDGKSLAVALNDGNINVYETSDWERTRTLSGHADAVMRVVYSPIGDQIASASQDMTVMLWNSGTGSLLYTLTGHQDYVNCVAYSPEGKHVASASDDGTVRLWDTDTGECIRTLSGHDGGATCVACSPLRKQIASACGDYKIRLWDIDTGACHILTGHSDKVYDIKYSPQGDQLASVSGDRTVRLWNVETQVCRYMLLGHKTGAVCVAFSPSGGQLASGSMDGTVMLWDANTGDRLRELTGHGEHHITSVVYSPKDKYLASSATDKTVRLWSV